MGTINARFAGFIKCTGFVAYDGGKILEVKLRINPNSITSYFGNEIDINGVKKPVTTVYCVHPYYVDMTLDEFDKCMEEIERGISFEEPM